MFLTESDYIHEEKRSTKRPVAGVVVRVFEATFFRSPRKSTKRICLKIKNTASIECKIVCIFFFRAKSYEYQLLQGAATQDKDVCYT